MKKRAGRGWWEGALATSRNQTYVLRAYMAGFLHRVLLNPVHGTFIILNTGVWTNTDPPTPPPFVTPSFTHIRPLIIYYTVYNISYYYLFFAVPFSLSVHSQLLNIYLFPIHFGEERGKWLSWMNNLAFLQFSKQNTLNKFAFPSLKITAPFFFGLSLIMNSSLCAHSFHRLPFSSPLPPLQALKSLHPLSSA